MQRILIMGLPGAGKTTLAQALQKKLGNCAWFNADKVREQFNDWDFTHEGRIRQSKRMRELAELAGNCPTLEYVIADFVAPLVDMRDNFNADWTVWVDTIQHGRHADTNAIFQDPEIYDFRVTEKDADKWAEHIAKYILDKRNCPKFILRQDSRLHYTLTTLPKWFLFLVACVIIPIWVVCNPGKMWQQAKKDWHL